MSEFGSLKELYVDQLQDNYSANKQMAGILSEFENAVETPKLKSYLKTAQEKIQQHQSTLEGVIKSHNADPDGEHCKGMQGLVREGRAHGLEPQFKDKQVQEAAIIAQLNRMNHYGLAGYGTTKAMAQQLGLSEDEQKLNADLDDIYDGDRFVSMLAENQVNQGAAN
jgi:ferritin-like metal-binding protein YciE